MREIGYKDRNYYYKDIRNMRAGAVFCKPIQPDILKAAAKKALELLPQFAVRPVLKDGRLYYEDNDEDIVVVKEDGKDRYFGSEDTNGYLFYLMYSDRRFILSGFHGIGDHGGFSPFFMNIVYYYVTESGGDVPDIRTGTQETDELDAFDPYSKYADAKAEPTWEYSDPSPVFIFPEGSGLNESGLVHSYCIHISTKEFIGLTHEWETSFVPAIVSIISGTIADKYGVEDDTIVAYTTVNMRPVFDSKTQTNFSEVIALPMNRERRMKDRKQQCRELRAELDAQRTKENFSRIMASLISGVKKAEGKPDDAPCKVVLPFPTYLLTYPGRVEIPEGFEDWLESIRMAAAGRDVGRAVIIVAETTGDDMKLQIGGQIDVKQFCGSVMDKLTELGFTPSIEDMGEEPCDRFSLERIKIV